MTPAIAKESDGKPLAQPEPGFVGAIGSRLQRVGRWARVTDAGLVHLKGLNELQGLHLAGTKFTNAGVKELEKALPKVKIER